MVIKFLLKFIIILIFFIPGSCIFAQTLEDSIQKGLEISNALHAASLEWASLNEKLNQSAAGKEIMGTFRGSLSETYSGTSGDYNNSFRSQNFGSIFYNISYPMRSIKNNYKNYHIRLGCQCV